MKQKHIAWTIMMLLCLFSCKSHQPEKQAGYIVQVSLGHWKESPYTAEQIISRIDTVSRLIPLERVVIGWSLETDVYRQVGDYLHDKGIRMLLWLPVFAETEAVFDHRPAVDLWCRDPSQYDLRAVSGFRFNCPTDPASASDLLAIYDSTFIDCGFDGAVLSWNIMEAPDAHIACLQPR